MPPPKRDPLPWLVVGGSYFSIPVAVATRWNYPYVTRMGPVDVFPVAGGTVNDEQHKWWTTDLVMFCDEVNW